MLPAPNRLKKEQNFKRVFKEGDGFKKSFLFLKLLNRDDQRESRFGFVVSTKVSKKAVTRNKIKRRLREIVRDKISEVKSGRDVIIVTQPGIDTQSFHQLKQNLLQLLKKADLIKNESVD